MFDEHKLIHYLHTQNRPEILDYLVNKLYNEYRDNIRMVDFFLPQLCHMCITKELSLPLERFMLKMATRQQVIGLKMLRWF